MSDQTLLYITILVMSVLGLGLAFVAFSYRNLINKYDALKKQKEEKEKELDVETKKIIEEAKLRAQKIIKDAELVTDDVKKAITTELVSTSEAQAKQYQAALSEAKDQMINLMSRISNNIQGEALKEIEEFKAKLEKQTIASQQGIQAKVDEVNKKLEVQINALKEARMKQIDNTVFEILKQVTRDVLGRAINPKDHEELVMKSLEEAKKQNIF